MDGVAAEVGASFFRLGDHWIVRVFRPLDQQIVAAAGEAEAVGIAVVDQRWNSFLADQGSTAKAADAVRPVRFRRQRHRMVDPMHEIGTGGVTPLNEIPVGAVRVVLVEDVVTALPEQGSVDVVHPRGWRREVIGWPMRVAGKGVGEVAGLPNPRFHLVYLVFSSHGCARGLAARVSGSGFFV